MARTKHPKLDEKTMANLESLVLNYVERNRGHAIPNKRLARAMGVAPHQVQTARKHLVERGKIYCTATKTYDIVLAPQPATFSGIAETTPNTKTVGEAIDEHFAKEVKTKAQAYYWATGNDSLKAFVKSLGSKND